MDSRAKFWLQEGHTHELVVAQACVVLLWLSSTFHGCTHGYSPVDTHHTWHKTWFQADIFVFAHPIDVSLESRTPCASGSLCVLSGIKIPCDGVNSASFPTASNSNNQFYIQSLYSFSCTKIPLVILRGN